MHFLSDELDDYVTKHSQDEPELLAQLNRETHLKILQPRMLSGHFQGRVLSMLSKIIHPTNILEIGTYTGYATLCLAEGLAENGTIDTIDVNEELVDFQRKYFDRSQWGNQIFQHLGPALDIIPTLGKNYDLVFIDADNQLRWILPSRLGAVETVFAMTVHKSQGSEFRHTVLVLPERDNPVLCRELLYTGITRAAKQLTLVVPDYQVLKQAVQRRTVRAGRLPLDE